jgi:hypothetical protein
MRIVLVSVLFMAAYRSPRDKNPPLLRVQKECSAFSASFPRPENPLFFPEGVVSFLAYGSVAYTEVTRTMKKTIVVVLILAVVAAAGAFADFGLGLIGSLYMDKAEFADATYGSVADAFRQGEGIYYGLMGEFMGKKWSLGGAYMASFYRAWFDSTIPMMDMDLNLYLGGHFLGTRSILDPSLEGGLGYIFKDYADKKYDDDPDNPLTRTLYWYLGAGLGVNLGPVGVFGKFIYHIPFRSQPPGTIEYYDELGFLHTTTIDLEDFALKPYKIVLGAKIMFPLVPRR